MAYEAHAYLLAGHGCIQLVGKLDSDIDLRGTLCPAKCRRDVLLWPRLIDGRFQGGELLGNDSALYVILVSAVDFLFLCHFSYLLGTLPVSCTDMLGYGYALNF